MRVNEKMKASDAFKIPVKIVIRIENTIIIKLQTPIGTGIFLLHSSIALPMIRCIKADRIIRFNISAKMHMDSKSFYFDYHRYVLCC